MMRIDCKVIEYKDINRFSESKEYNNIKNKLIICASSIGSLGMNILLKDNEQPILNIGPVINKILNEWDGQETKFMQNIALGVVIQELIAENSKTNFFTPNEMNILKSINNIRDDILSSIRLMLECNIYPEDFKNINSAEMKVFVKVWNKLEEKESSFQNLRDEFLNKESIKNIFNKKDYSGKLLIYGLKNGLEKQIKNLTNFKNKYKENKIDIYGEEPEYVSVIISKRVELYQEMIKKYDDMLKSGNIEIPDEIILHGFYFITPIQHKFLYELSKALNIQLTFLNNSDSSNEINSLEIWKYSFDDYNMNGEIIQDYSDLSDSWGCIIEYMYENRDKGYIKGKIEELYEKGYTMDWNSYPNIISLKNSSTVTNLINSQDVYYSPYSDEINSTFRNIESKNILSNLLDTPVGEFIKLLHSIWYQSREKKKFFIDVKLIQNIFSTGWLTIEYKGKEINAATYTNILKNLRPYFNKCTNIDEFDRTICILKSGKEYLGDDLGLENIICNFSFFDVSIEDIDIISTFIHTLKNLIEELDEPNEKIPQNKPIKVDKHFTALKEIIEKYKSNSSNKEIEILKIINTIINHRLKDKECLPKDVFEALEEYIDKKLKDENEELYENLVLDMDGAEFTQILGFSNSCLIQIDKDFMPANKSRLTWPLKENLLEDIMKKLNKEKRFDSEMLLNRLLLIINNKEARNKYLYYKMLESNKNIKLLMIDNLGKGITDESIYNTLLIDYVKEARINNKDNSNQSDTYIDKFNQSDIYTNPLIEKKVLKDSIEGTLKDYIDELMNINDNYYQLKKDIESKKEEIGFKLRELRKHIKSDLKDKGHFIQMNRIYNQCEKRFYYYIINEYKFASYRDDYHHKFLFSILIHIIHQKIITKSISIDDIKSSWPEITKIKYPKSDKKIYNDNFDIILNKIGQYFPQWNNIEKNNLKNNTLKYLNKNISYIIELECFKDDRIPIIIPSYRIENLDLNKYNKDGYNEEKLFLSGIPKINTDRNRGCQYCNFNDICIECNYEIKR